jgi:hypothetical protein
MVAPRLISLVRTIRRIQAVERIAMGTPRPARALTAGVVAAALLPLGTTARPIGLLFVLPSTFALVLSITVIQARLNAAWRAGAATVSHNTDTVVAKLETATAHASTETKPRKATTGDRRIQRAARQRRSTAQCAPRAESTHGDAAPGRGPRTPINRTELGHALASGSRYRRGLCSASSARGVVVVRLGRPPVPDRRTLGRMGP